MEAASAVVRCSVLDAVSLPVTELAIVTDRPSRTQAVPRPRTKRVWNGDQRSRSSRAGMVLRIGCRMVLTVITIRPSSLAPGWREAEELSDAGASCGAATVVPARPAQSALHSVSTDTVGVPQHHQHRLHL